MYSVSESYKKALLEKHITDTVSGTAELKDGTVLTLDDNTIVTGSLRITHELCEDYKVGTFNLGSLNIGFFDDNALGRDFSGAKIVLTYRIETEEGWESVPLGIFIADGQSVIRRRNTVTLTAYDYGILFDCTLGVTIRNMTGSAEKIISAVCERCGVEFAGIADGLPNTSVYITPSSEQIQSCRDLVGWCAAMIGGYAVIDRTGRLEIIPARYNVESDDPSVIIVDKYVTPDERDSIYSTDTRAWIAQMSAYSAGKAKIYKSNITRDDPQAARAIYYLEKNPLMENMSESLCDEVNCQWLRFMDGFMQRGITAELYGDPALDVGDIIRCSGGDVDQRSSVVGLVTKQEWRYRNLHTVICASAQLSDGFPDNDDETEGGSSETEAEEATDKVYPVRVVVQSEKKTGGGGGGGTYYAGQGLTLTADNAFKLNIANQADIGGLRIAGAESVSDGDVTADLGVYKTTEAFPALRTALRHQKGGFFLGDGFVPVLEEYEDNGETKYRVTDYVQLRLGDGLCFTDNDEEATDVKELRENSLGGRRLSAVKATKELFGTVRPGYGLLIDSEGNLRTIYTSGNGIDISATGEIAVKYDNKTIKLNENEELEASGGLTVENGIIIQEADAEYLLHEYTEVEYIAGNRIGYAGAQNQIITQGYIAYNADKVAKVMSAQKPDIQLYSDLVFEKPVFLCYNTSNVHSISRIYLRFKTATTTYNQYEIVYVTTEGTELIAQSINAYFNYVESTAALGLTWTSVNPPGYTTTNGKQYCEFGCAQITPVIVYSRSNASTPYVVSNLSSGVYFPYIQFASEAEYNAAVGLTYEANILTQVNETVTEV